MLKFASILTLLFASALALPQHPTAGQYNQNYPSQESQTSPIPIINFDDSQPGDGTFKYR